MIQCKGCGFGVNEMMRFALMKNLCPSCGAALLSSKDSNTISTIQSRILSQRFASSLTESLVYDLSLFIFNELKGGFGKLAIELTPRAKAQVEEDDGIYHSEEDLDLDSIRREVLAELSHSEGSDVSEDSEDSEESDEDVESKAERLKKLYQQRASASTTDSQRSNFRRGGFKGISRST
jgi:hypothetical protein